MGLGGQERRVEGQNWGGSRGGEGLRVMEIETEQTLWKMKRSGACWDGNK